MEGCHGSESERELFSTVLAKGCPRPPKDFIEVKHQEPCSCLRMSGLADKVKIIMEMALLAVRIQERVVTEGGEDCISISKYVLRTPKSWKFGAGSVLEVIVTVNSKTYTIKHSWCTKVCGWDGCYTHFSDVHSFDSEEELINSFETYMHTLGGEDSHGCDLEAPSGNSPSLKQSTLSK